MHMYAFLYPPPLFLLYILTALPLARAFLLSFATDVSPAAPNSNFTIIWARELDTEPQDRFSLVYSTPDGGPSVQDIEEKGANHGQVDLETKGEGPYVISAVDTKQNVLANLTFQISGNTGSGTTAMNGAPFSTTSTSTSDSTETSTTSSDNPANSTVSNSTTQSETTQHHSTSSSNNTTTQTGTPSSDFPTLPSSTPSDNTPAATSSSVSSDTAPNSDAATGSASSKPNLAVILGASIGGAFLIALLILLFICFRRRQQKDRPVTFHRDMMVRSPGPSLYALSRAASPAGGYPGRVGSPVGLNNGRVGSAFGGPRPEYTQDEEEGEPGSFTDLLAQASSIANSSSHTSVPSPLHESIASDGVTLRRKNSNPFRDPELMGRLSMHFDDSSVSSLHNPGSPPVPPLPSTMPITPMPPMHNSPLEMQDQSPSGHYAYEEVPSPNYSRPHPYVSAINHPGEMTYSHQ